MHKTIALLRGINVGGKNKLPMKELTTILEGMGLQNVQTYIQSGNVVFESEEAVAAETAVTIQQRILTEKGFAPQVLLLTAQQLQAAIDANPYPTEDGKLLHFYFFATQPSEPDIEKLKTLKKESEQFWFTPDVLFLYAPEGIGRSKLATAVEKAVGVPTTARNWNTVRRLGEMAGGVRSE